MTAFHPMGETPLFATETAIALHSARSRTKSAIGCIGGRTTEDVSGQAIECHGRQSFAGQVNDIAVLWNGSG
jgi:hypothetical protein